MAVGERDFQGGGESSTSRPFSFRQVEELEESVLFIPYARMKITTRHRTFRFLRPLSPTLVTTAPLRPRTTELQRGSRGSPEPCTRHRTPRASPVSQWQLGSPARRQVVIKVL